MELNNDAQPEPEAIKDSISIITYLHIPAKAVHCRWVAGCFPMSSLCPTQWVATADRQRDLKSSLGEWCSARERVRCSGERAKFRHSSERQRERLEERERYWKPSGVRARERSWKDRERYWRERDGGWNVEENETPLISLIFLVLFLNYKKTVF